MDYILAVEDATIVLQRYLRGLTKRLSYLKKQACRLEVSDINFFVSQWVRVCRSLLSSCNVLRELDVLGKSQPRYNHSRMPSGNSCGMTEIVCCITTIVVRGSPPTRSLLRCTDPW